MMIVMHLKVVQGSKGSEFRKLSVPGADPGAPGAEFR